MYNLAVMLAHGAGVAEDSAGAVSLMQQAASLGDASALFWLAHRTHNDSSLGTKDDVVRCLLEADRLGDGRACHYAALMMLEKQLDAFGGLVCGTSVRWGDKAESWADFAKSMVAWERRCRIIVGRAVA